MDSTQPDYDEISKHLLSLLYRFSNEIMRVNASIMEMQKNPAFNTNENFRLFVMNFNEGRYYHFQCQGYIECLVVTKCYTQHSVRYWIDRLFKPALDYFMRAKTYYERMMAQRVLSESAESAVLGRKMQSFLNIAQAVQDEVAQYNIR